MHAYDQVWKSITGVAGATTIERYTPVSIDSMGTLITTANGAKSLGILYEDADVQGGAFQIVASGIAFVNYGGAVTAGSDVEVADGKVVPLSTGTSIGTAMISGVTGDIGCILLNR